MKYDIFDLTVDELHFILRLLEERGVTYPPGSEVAEMIKSIQSKVE
jgi:hypothetical protein